MKHRVFIIIALGVASLLSRSVYSEGLRVPDVPVTGGKKQSFLSNGKVSGVQPMPGLSKPTIVSWQDFTQKHYDLRRTLPKPRPQELVRKAQWPDRGMVSTVYLPQEMEILVRKNFSLSPYNGKELWVESFANIVAEFKKIKANARATDALLERLESKYPAIYAEVSPYLPQLVRDDFLYSSRWDPYRDESIKGKQNDGILFVAHWVMQPDASRLSIWNENPGEHKVYQAATIIYADLQNIKEMEKDFADYFSQIGQAYQEVYPLPGSYLRGVDPNGNEFVRMQLFLRNRLPFPFDTASYVMDILDHYDDKGRFVCDYYSENKEDLNWMAGRDSYFELRTTTGELVGNLIVTNLDFDIKNVPERDVDRIVSMKAGLGNMKRLSEERFEKKSLSGFR